MISIFYQAEGLRDVAHLEKEAEAKLASVREQIAKATGLDKEAILFLEDAEEPLELEAAIGKIADARGVKLHLHRCRQVGVSVTFNGRVVHHQFTPATTVAKVKKWAAIREFGMTAEEAGEHVLQVAGTHDRPTPGTHIGTLVKHPHCKIAFTLVPDERVNGNNDAAV